MGDGNNSFLRAARDGNLEDVLEYLKGSTDINTSNSNGLNALHLTSKEGHIKIVEELLSRGANIEAATKKGNTALHIASLAGHLNIVSLLVENKAKVNVQAQFGFTPLYMAAQEGHSEVVKYLLSNGASQGLATQDGFTPLAVALQQGNERVVSVLLEHDSKGKVKLPALHIAAKKDDMRSANLLLQNEQNDVNGETKDGGLVNDTTKSGFTPLHIAAHYGNINVATLLISKGADVNFRAKNNITPLHVASRWGKDKMVTLLLDNKAVIDEKTRDGLSPLHCSARSGHEMVVDTLLERGAPKSSTTKNGLTPLHMAAQGDHMDCARLLLYHKAPVDDVTVDYLTPLHVAGHCGNVKTAKLLLDRKCNPNARALNGFTPLHIACKKNRIKVVELLLKYGASIQATTESGLTPLHVASFMGHMNIVISLIQNNASPDHPTVRGETSLHLAARANQTDIIRILLRNGATVDARAREQQTPLHIAARLGNVDNVTLLLQHGANADAVTKDLYTPLHIAAKEGNEEVASVLLDHGASHGLTTKKGFTPLHIAAKYGNIKVASLLLQKGANPDVQGKNGLTPLHVATHYNHSNVAFLLLDHKASPHCTAKNGYTPLHIAAKKNQMDIATTLLEFGADPNAESKNGFSPLHLAAQEGHTDMVSLLLEHKSNVGAKAHNGLTPMHLAAQEDKVNVAEVLVKYGSEIDPQTKAGYTPLHTSCHFGQINMVRFLLEHEASVSATTKLGYTPLHQAAQQGHVQVVNLLLKNKASPNAVSNNGQTALSIAQRLGYISVVDTLAGVTEVTETIPTAEDKYKVVSPETMQETLLSDSEDEGGEDTISLERGESSSPLDTSYEGMKEFQFRHPVTDDQRRRIKSEISTAMRYPSYLQRDPDYEAEMQYFRGDTLSPSSREKGSSRGDSVFGADYSTLERMDQSNSQSDVHIRSVDASTSELDFTDDFDDSMKKDFMEREVMTQSFATYSQSAPDTRLSPGAPKKDMKCSSYSGSSFNTSFDPDNVAIERTPTYSGKLKWKSFLISFMVDARGGALRGRRHSGVRIIIPPRKASMPTRVTCRLITKEKLNHPLPLNEGEALASRILEMGPVGTKFLGNIVLEVPHFASLRGKEREIKILRSNNGEKWDEHPIVASDEAVNKALEQSMEVSDLEQEDEATGKRITRILTDDLPRYFALVTKIKEERRHIGGEGGVISSTVVPQVQAVFPEGALTKKIKVGLQAQKINPDLVAKMLGNRVAVSPIVTVEPRRRKFHKDIILTIPVPKAAQKGMINQYSSEAPTLRVLYSIAEGTDVSVWEDYTKAANIKFSEDCVSITTSVSGRFWLMDCQNIADATRMGTELYHEAITIPYMARFVCFAKRTGEEEGKLRMFCMTDDRLDKTLEKQEHFVEVARSRDVEVFDGRPQFVEMAGNLIPITKSGDQLYINFKAFRENRLPCTLRIRDLDQDPAARVAFMKEPKVARGEVPQTPICNLNVSLPDMSTSSSMEMDGEAVRELRNRSSLIKEHGIVVQDRVQQASIRLTDVADTLKGDWVMLAQQLDVSSSEINDINNQYKTVNDQALAMLQMWVDKDTEPNKGQALERALIKINREDVVKKCIYNVENVEDEMEAAAARVAMDQSGFDTFTEEVGISREDSMKRNMSLDVQFDEQDMVKESESVVESPSSDDKQAPQALEEETETREDEFVIRVDERRPQAKEEVKVEKQDEDFFDLIDQLDKYSQDKERGTVDREDIDDKPTVTEDEIVHTKHERLSPEEIISIVESIDQQAAPPPQKQQQQESVEDEEGLHTPPPSPVEKDTYEEETRETSLDTLAARLSVGDGTTESQAADETGVLPEIVFKEDIVQETETLQAAAPPIGGVDYDARQKLTDTASVQQEQYEAGQVEPDMAQIVESLREDLMPEGRDVTRKRKMTTSSSSSSSDYESDKEVEGIPQETKKVTITENEEIKDETLGDGSKPKQETNVRAIIDQEKRKSSSSSSSEDETDSKVRPPPSTVDIEEVRKEENKVIVEQPGDASRDQQLPVKQKEITQEVKSRSRSSSSGSSASEKSVEKGEIEKEATKSAGEQVPQTKQIEITEERKEVVEKVKPRSSSSSSSSASEQDVERGEETVEIEKQEVIKATGNRIPPAKQTEGKKEVLDEVRIRSRSSSSSSSGGQDTERKEDTKDVLEATEPQIVFERDDIPASKYVEISEDKSELIAEVRPGRTRSTSSSSSRSSVSDKEIERTEQTIDVQEKVVEVRKPSGPQVTSPKQTTDQIDREIKPRSSSSSSSSSSEDEKSDVKKEMIEVTKTEVVTSQIPPSKQSEEMVGSESASSSDDEDSRPGCEVNITQTTVIKIKEERPKTTVQETEDEGQSIEKLPGSRTSSSSSTGPKTSKRKGSSGSESGGYSSGSSSEGQDSSARVLSQVERQERFETVEKKKLLSRDGPSTVETETQAADHLMLDENYQIDQDEGEDFSGPDEIVTKTWKIDVDGEIIKDKYPLIDIEVKGGNRRTESVSSSSSSSSSSSENGKEIFVQCERGEEFETITKPSYSSKEIPKNIPHTDVWGFEETHCAREEEFEETQRAREEDIEEIQHAREEEFDSQCDRGEDFEVEIKATLSKFKPESIGSSRSIFSSSMSESSMGGTDVVEEIYDLARQVEREEQYEVTSRPVLFGKGDMEPVFDANLSGGQSMYEETLPDGTVVRHTKMHTIQHPSVSGNIELVEEEGPEREVVDYDEDENILPDGTVHRVTRMKRHSLKHIHRSVKSEDSEKEIFEGEVEVPGSTREEIVEVYEDPPRFVKDVEEVDVCQPDGSIIKRKVTSGRVVHKIKTRSLSIDESGNVEEEEYSVDEVVPMTESAFAEGVSSSSSSDTVSSDSEDDEAQQIRANPGFMKENRMHVHFRSDEPDFEGDDFLPEQEFHELDESGFAKRDITKISYEPRLEEEESSSYEEYEEEDTDQSLPPAILITEDNTVPPEEGSDVLAYFGIKNPDDDQSEGAEGGDVQKARMVMTKQIHTTTVLKDGQEHTTVHEETNVQEDDTPDVLRESMQGIIDQFMEQPPKQEKPTSHETEI